MKLESDRVDIPSVGVFNPLPRALHHYEKSLLQTLASSYHVRVQRADFELGGGGRLKKLSSALKGLMGQIKAARSSRLLVVLWPSFGLLDLALWRVFSRGEPRFVVIHDPTPLREQIGFSPLAVRVGRWGSRGNGLHVIAHTRLASDVLHSMGIEVDHVLPHPIYVSPEPTQTSPSKRRGVLVAGQHKDARDLSIIEDFAANAPAQWPLHIAGRGWPDLAGWNIDSRFLDETEFSDRLSTSAALLLPYRYYFQSGVAVRALESGCPIVAERHEFLEEVFGADWPGFVTGDAPKDWIEAASRAMESSPPSPSKLQGDIRHSWESVLNAAVKKSWH